MTESNGIISENILYNMSEGVITLGFDGRVAYANLAASRLLGYERDELIGKQFAAIFFKNPENDAFVQTILDAVYDRSHTHSAIVQYIRGTSTLRLRVVTSFLENDGENLGVNIAFEDLSELYDLRDAVSSMEKIQRLNEQLELRNKLLNDTFGRFLSDEIVRELLETPGGMVLGGKRQHLTMMMSDLRGFTAISERMDPADLIAMLNHYLGAMTDVIQKYHGTIIEFIGDGIMAIFGAPVKSDAHASDAVAAAIGMEISMADVNSWNMAHGYPELKMGIGIATGDVILGNIGSEKRTKYGVVGSNVNLCGRIESYTGGGQILISPETRAQIATELSIVREMRVLPKGVGEELVLTQVNGIGEPYNLTVPKENSALKEIRPLPVCFHKLDGKHVNEKTYYGGIVSLGLDSAVLETDTALSVLDNVEFEAGGKLFSKVMEVQDGRYLLHYTYIPLGYGKWYERGVSGDGSS